MRTFCATLLDRQIKPDIVSDLAEKMVFVGGARQVGKTTLALSLLPEGEEARFQ